MKRVPEPELMDSRAQTQAYAEADFSDSNSLFVECFTQAFPKLAQRGALADLGCGPADICIRLSNVLPGWRITGVDAGPNMLKQAERAIRLKARESHISLRLCRLPDTSLGAGSFDAVVSNSLLHHLPDPAILWNTIRQIARPGAAITVMDLSRPDSEAEAEQLVEEYAGAAPAILREDFFNSLLAAYTPIEVRGQLSAAGLDGMELQRPSDRHWIVTGAFPG